MVTKTYRPQHRVRLRTAVDKYQTEMDLSSDVVKVHTVEGYERAAGSWQILLTWRTTAVGLK